MNEELETKKEWITPEIVDLDVDKTASSQNTDYKEATWAGPTS